MADYRNGSTTARTNGGGAGRALAVIAVVAIVIVGLLFLTGFWRADVKSGALPDVKVSAKGGEMPDVDLQSKKVVVGTKATTVDVPKVKTEKTTIDVPVVGVSDGKKVSDVALWGIRRARVAKVTRAFFMRWLCDS